MPVQIEKYPDEPIVVCRYYLVQNAFKQEQHGNVHVDLVHTLGEALAIVRSHDHYIADIK